MNLAMDRPVYINESLLPARRKLFARAKEVKNAKHFKYLWVRNGKIFLRRDGQPVIVVTCQADLNKTDYITNKMQTEDKNQKNKYPTISSDNFLFWRNKMKDAILETSIIGNRYAKERDQLKYVLERTVKYGESDSVLLIGLKGSGKTTILNNTISCLKSSGNYGFNTVRLNGFIHTDDSLALKDIIAQMHLEEQEGDRVAGSFSDNLLFLLQSLQTGDSQTSKPVIFILDEFHLFCSHRNQTLLYNLFEAAQANWAPICVVGLTTRVDVTELLEKRVKSRFSHRSILLLPNYSSQGRVELFHALLSLNESCPKTNNSSVQMWNSYIDDLCNDKNVQEILQMQIFSNNDEKLFRYFLLYVVCNVPVSSILRNNILTPEKLKICYETWYSDAKVAILQGLSPLELCLVIVMSHQMELYDEEPFNFEMILDRYLKFARRSNSVKLCERSVVLKAFERLQALELILPISGVGRRSNLKEYEMYSFLLTKSQVKHAVQSCVGLQTDIIQWATNSLA